MGHWKKFSEATVFEALAGSDVESIMEELVCATAKAHKFQQGSRPRTA